MSALTSHRPLRIKTRLFCPHCWQEFPADQLLFISESPDLPKDPKLSGEQPIRFLPQRFNLAGAALDPHDVPCDKLACPVCHLPIPRPWLYLNTFFLSIAGKPSSGKSYFLASMIWQLRQTMGRCFLSNFTDADPQMNRRIFDGETVLFTGGNNPDKLVRIEKTEEEGNIYNNTVVNGTPTRLAQPFTYMTEPMPNHPFLQKANRARQVICVYDNAGEHFLPGKDHITAPVTRHMAKSDALLFIFDPTQDAQFRTARAACPEPVEDPQMSPGVKGEVQFRVDLTRQEVVLGNIAAQIRNQNLLPPYEKIKIPLIIVLSKYDAWFPLCKGQFPAGKAPHEQNPWKLTADKIIHYYHADRVERYSQILRELLMGFTSNLVSTAESAFETVRYIAVSATGGKPAHNEQDGMFYHRPVDVKPIWAEIPFLHAQCLANKSAVPFIKGGKGAM